MNPRDSEKILNVLMPGLATLPLLILLYSLSFVKIREYILFCSERSRKRKIRNAFRADSENDFCAIMFQISWAGLFERDIEMKLSEWVVKRLIEWGCNAKKGRFDFIQYEWVVNNAAGSRYYI